MFFRKPPPPKVQTSNSSSKDSMSSIPEELLFPDTPSAPPTFTKSPGRGRGRGRGRGGRGGGAASLASPPVSAYHGAESRPSNIISPPVQKFPKLSPDSGFPGSPDLLDPTDGRLLPQGDPAAVAKSVSGPSFAPSPSIIKHTDPRAAVPGVLMQQQQQQQQLLGAAVPKIQRRPSASQLPPSPQLPDPSRLVAAPGQQQSVISRKSVDGALEPAAFIQQRRASGGQQQQLQQQQQQQRRQQQQPQQQQQQRQQQRPQKLASSSYRPVVQLPVSFRKRQ